jgi:hypothetical protein
VFAATSGSPLTVTESFAASVVPGEVTGVDARSHPKLITSGTIHNRKQYILGFLCERHGAKAGRFPQQAKAAG